MKKKYIIPGVMTLAVLATAAGITTTAQAAGVNTSNLLGKFKFAHEQRQELTAAQKAEMQTKQDAVKTAINNGDYNAWVTAIKAIDTNYPALSKITADNFKTYADAQKTRYAEIDSRKVLMDTVQTALTNGDYDGWVKAETAVNASSPMLTKITKDNFNKFVEAHKLMNQANTIMKDLGIEGGRGMMNGDGMGRGGMHEGKGRGMMGGEFNMGATK